jgi:hypothetical protein
VWPQNQQIQAWPTPEIFAYGKEGPLPGDTVRVTEAIEPRVTEAGDIRVTN